MTTIIQNNVSNCHQESPNEILHTTATQDRMQIQAVANKLSDESAGTASSKITRMRFTVCILGMISLAMGQMSRTVINYCITSMVDPRMLSTNHLTAASGASCPVIGSLQEKQTIDLPEVHGLDEDHLIALMPAERLQNGQLAMHTGRSSPDSEEFGGTLNETTGEKFMWTVNQQSLIKGGFFYSYFLFQILGGRIAEVYGAKYVILVGTAGSAIINLATPWLARYSFPSLIASRMLMGAVQSAGFPAMYALINRWLTKSEASIYTPMLKMTLRVGQVLASMAPGFIPDWPYVFYLFGFLGIVWSIFWISLSTSDPCTNKWVSEAELSHIMREKRRKNVDANEKTSSLETPWLKIITSPSVIGLVIAKLAFSFCNSLITIELPSYLRFVYHASLQEMSLITTVMFSTQVPMTLMAGWLAKVMCDKHPFGMSTTTIRKFFQSMATFGTGISLVLVTFSDCSLLYTGIMLQILSVFAVFVAGGETMLPYDLSDEYPATIMAIANTMSNLSGITVTTLTGLVLADQGGSQSRWNMVILLVAAADMFGGLIFCLLVKAKPIDFASNEQNSPGQTEMGAPSQLVALETLPQVAHLSEHAVQSKKANELTLDIKIDHPAIYRSDSRE